MAAATKAKPQRKRDDGTRLVGMERNMKFVLQWDTAEEREKKKRRRIFRWLLGEEKRDLLAIFSSAILPPRKSIDIPGTHSAR